jgi:hypothetical protein
LTGALLHRIVVRCANVVTNYGRRKYAWQMRLWCC